MPSDLMLFMFIALLLLVAVIQLRPAHPLLMILGHQLLVQQADSKLEMSLLLRHLVVLAVVQFLLKLALRQESLARPLLTVPGEPARQMVLKPEPFFPQPQLAVPEVHQFLVKPVHQPRTPAPRSLMMLGHQPLVRLVVSKPEMF